MPKKSIKKQADSLPINFMASFCIVVVYVLLQLEVRDKVISVSAIVKALPSELIA
jgi:hypothetical protein